MNKFILILALLCGAFASETATAGFNGPQPNSPLTTVENARRLADETQVTLQGRIEKSLGGEKYIFNDATGSIQVEIDDDLWTGINVTPQTKIEISGEVDTHREKPTDIEVQTIKLL